jgi:hypothetical protein
MEQKSLWELFEEDLLSLFGEKIKSDVDFCYRLYGSLGNVDWFKDKDKYSQDDWDSHVSASFRQSGSMIAEWRGKGESYLDFYCMAPEGHVDEEIAEKMAERGWSFKEF